MTPPVLEIWTYTGRGAPRLATGNLVTFEARGVCLGIDVDAGGGPHVASLVSGRKKLSCTPLGETVSPAGPGRTRLLFAVASEPLFAEPVWAVCLHEEDRGVAAWSLRTLDRVRAARAVRLGEARVAQAPLEPRELELELAAEIGVEEASSELISALGIEVQLDGHPRRPALATTLDARRARVRARFPVELVEDDSVVSVFVGAEVRARVRVRAPARPPLAVARAELFGDEPSGYGYRPLATPLRRSELKGRLHFGLELEGAAGDLRCELAVVDGGRVLARVPRVVPAAEVATGWLFFTLERGALAAAGPSLKVALTVDGKVVRAVAVKVQAPATVASFASDGTLADEGEPHAPSDTDLAEHLAFFGAVPRKRRRRTRG